MSYIIVTRNPNTQKLVVITDGDDGTPVEFETEDEAAEVAHENGCCRAWGAEVVSIDN